ncbi:hypothetical protein Ancab_009168 [Ancistrocladus abbreviatus]
MVMESFALLKFWKTTTYRVAGTTISDSTSVADEPVVEPAEGSDDDDDEDDNDESFFELELKLPNYDYKHGSQRNLTFAGNDIGSDFCSAERVISSPISSQFDPSSSMKTKIEAGENNGKVSSKPQSPISILRSAVAPPKLRVFMFGKLRKSSSAQRLEEATAEASSSNPINSASKEPGRQNQRSKKLFTVKWGIEDGSSSVLRLNRSNSSRLLSSPKTQSRTSASSCTSSSSEESSSSSSSLMLDDDGSSKRFSKDAVQKYLNLIKPLYVKVSKRCNDKEEFTPPTTTTVSALFRSPTPPRKASMNSAKHGVSATGRGEKQNIRFKVSYKNLRKYRSASSVVGVASSPTSRKDDSLIQQNDAIEGAILHCKRSLNSSRDRSLLSRCTSDKSN